MGRLFWKFFFFIWLAQLSTIIGVSAVFWWDRHQDHARWEAIHAARGNAGADARMPDRAERPFPHPLRGERMPPPLRMPPPYRLPIVPLIASLLASLVFAFLLARYVSKPIRRLRQAFDAVAGGRLETRLGDAMKARNDELADLGKEFDRMASQMQVLVTGQRRLLHDVSHEMRSPLARVQTAIGLARQQPEKSVTCMERIEKESIRMDLLIDELLTLSRLESGMVKSRTDDIEIAELLAGIVGDAQFEAEAKGVHIEIGGDTGATVEGDGELLHRAIENVVRNAVKYTPPGSTVSVSFGLDLGKNELWIHVEDGGPGVFEHDLDNLFSPFYRGSQRSDIHGYGLGLAIAKGIIESMRGRISGSNLAHGFQVKMMFPAKTAAHVHADSLSVA